MQPNTITLSVDTDNDGGTTAAVDAIFSRYHEYDNRSEYIASDHSLAARNMLGLYRTQPKPNGNFKGMARSAVKNTKDFEVAGVDAVTTIVAPAIANTDFNFPVGMTPEQTLEMRMLHIAALIDDLIMVPLTDQLMV